MLNNRIYDGIIGLCVGDALGVPVEFVDRDVLHKNPVVNMREYGTHNQHKGTWSDDTTMTLCLLDSIADCVGIGYNDIMKKFLSWVNEGKYTAHDELFDIGVTTRKAIMNYAEGVSPLECGCRSEYDNGNGALMRILPMAFYVYSKYGGEFYKNDIAMEEIHNVCALTHGHIRSQIACGIYVNAAVGLLCGETSVEEISNSVEGIIGIYERSNGYSDEMEYFCRMKNMDSFLKLPEEEIYSSGYVVHTLEASLWCLLNTNNYRKCVLKAVNLGDDTDTTGAVAGGLAGLRYGADSIPQEWVRELAKLSFIKSICSKAERVL